MNTDANQSARQGPSLSTILVVLGLGFLLVAYVSYLRPEARVNRDFVETTCTIVAKQLVVLQDRNGVVYRPEFQIRYRAGDDWYETRTYNITGESTRDRAQKEDILSRFDLGQTYPCWYDPQDPRVAVLVRGYSVFGLILAGFGIIVLLIGLVGLM
jgi:hypothetical protein